MDNEFQYRLVKAIANKQMSASDLSRATGIDKAAISNYINGKYVPKQDKCYLIARALDVNPGWLMTGEETRKMYISTEYTLPFHDSVLEMLTSPEDIELEKLWPSASVPARRAALAVLRSMKEDGTI